MGRPGRPLTTAILFHRTVPPMNTPERPDSDESLSVSMPVGYRAAGDEEEETHLVCQCEREEVISAGASFTGSLWHRCAWIAAVSVDE